MIYTFYSYKGGVGRSMALAAVARVLAGRGAKVLVVDFGANRSTKSLGADPYPFGLRPDLFQGPARPVAAHFS